MPELSKTTPDIAKAIYSISMASELLDAAVDRFYAEDYMDAYDNARNSIRMSGMALLYRDGFISENFNSVALHLRENYDGLLPIEEWEYIEGTSPSEGLLYNMLLKAMGLIQKSGERQAKEAVQVAGKFLETARSELSQ